MLLHQAGLSCFFGCTPSRDLSEGLPPSEEEVEKRSYSIRGRTRITSGPAAIHYGVGRLSMVPSPMDSPHLLPCRPGPKVLMVQRGAAKAKTKPLPPAEEQTHNTLPPPPPPPPKIYPAIDEPPEWPIPRPLPSSIRFKTGASATGLPSLLCAPSSSRRRGQTVGRN